MEVEPIRELADYDRLLVAAWGGLVERIERGYDDSLAEYRNDLAVRDLLAEHIGGISDGELRARLEQEITEIDRRYRGATRIVERSIDGRSDRSWWWLRVPIELRGELGYGFEGVGRGRPRGMPATSRRVALATFVLVVVVPGAAMIVVGARTHSWLGWILATIGALWILRTTLGVVWQRRQPSSRPDPDREER